MRHFTGNLQRSPKVIDSFRFIPASPQFVCLCRIFLARPLRGKQKLELVLLKCNLAELIHDAMMLISHLTFRVSLSLFSWPLNSAHQIQRLVLLPGKVVNRIAAQDNRETYKQM